MLLMRLNNPFRNLFLLIILLQNQWTLSGQGNEKSIISNSNSIYLESTILQETREVFIYEPPDFWGIKDSNPLPIILVLDGESQFNHTKETVDFLSAAPMGNDLIPRSLVVGLKNANRNRDLSPIKGMIGNDPETLKTTGGGPQFLKFITTELLPYIDQNYNTCSHRTLIGHSLGGLLTFEALLNYSEHFDNYIVIDPGFGFADEAYMEMVLKAFEERTFTGKNIILATGQTRPSFLLNKNVQQDTSDIISIMDKPNEKFRLLADKGKWKANITINHYPEENHFSIPLIATKEALQKLFHYYPYKNIIDYYHHDYKHRKDLVKHLENHYQNISDKLSCRIFPMQSYLNSFAYGLSSAGRNDLSEDLFNYSIACYPKSSDAYMSFAQYLKAQGKIDQAIELLEASSLYTKSDEMQIFVKENK